MQPLRAAGLFILVLLLLDFAFALAGLPARGAMSLLVPAADALLFALLVCVWVWLSLPGRRVFFAALSAFAVLLLCFRAADSLVPLFFDRPFELYTDWSYLPDLYALMRDTQAPLLFYSALALLAAALAAAGYGMYRAFAALAAGFQRAQYRAVFLAALGMLSLLSLTAGLPFLSGSSMPRVVEEMAKVARRPAYVEAQTEYLADRGSETVSAPLVRLGGRNVLLFIIESYGYTLYGEPIHFEPIREDLERIEAALQGADYGLASNFLDSPAFGGNSWLADSTLASGVRVDNEEDYRLLLNSEVMPMAGYFNDAGYRTVSVMPATTYAWPEGDYFRFQKQYHFQDLGYRGPNLKWAPMPDQYVLDVMHRREVSTAAQPLFLQYVLVSSHYPFNLIPLYVEDWDQIGDGGLYARDGSVRTLPIRAGSQTAGAEGYAAAMRYELTLIGEYLRRFIDDQSLVVVLGDHQPFSGITGKGRPRSVPVHVISRQAELLEPFLKRGYTPGLVPRQPPPHAGMESFLPGFLQDFSPAAPQEGSPGARTSPAAAGGRETGARGAKPAAAGEAPGPSQSAGSTSG